MEGKGSMGHGAPSLGAIGSSSSASGCIVCSSSFYFSTRWSKGVDGCLHVLCRLLWVSSALWGVYAWEYIISSALSLVL